MIHSEKAINAGVMMLNSSDRMKNWRVPGSDIFQYAQSIAQPERRMHTQFYQVKVIYNNQIKAGIFKKVSAPFEFSAPMINQTKEEALGYAPYFIKELIEDGSLPQEAVKFGKVNEDIIKVRIDTLEIALMEKDISDK